MKESTLRLMKENFPGIELRRNEPMKKHTTFRAGGTAAYYLVPSTIEELKDCLKLLKEQEEPYYLIGNGSNLLVSDSGYEGIVIQLMSQLNHITVTDLSIEAEAGALLSKIAKVALKHQLEGFEFAAGIPGTLGGAVVMNAGAYGGEMKQVIDSVKVMDENLQIREISGADMQFEYRTSLAKTKKYVVLSAKILLKKGDDVAIEEKMLDYKRQRTMKQPLDFPSAGSTFKRPEGHFAGKLIDEAGLRGFQIGGAQVSEKHCGFVINRNQASASDIYRVMMHVQKQVFDKTGIQLKPEVCMLGEFKKEVEEV